MREHRVDHPAAFLRELGELHDVRVLQVTYSVEHNTLDLEVEDLNWNLEQIPGYVPRPATLLFGGIAAFSITAGQDKFHTSLVNGGASIADAHAISKNGMSRMNIMMSTGEQWHVEFKTLTVHDRSAL